MVLASIFHAVKYVYKVEQKVKNKLAQRKIFQFISKVKKSQKTIYSSYTWGYVMQT